MIILPEDFELHKYGLDVRLVNESDAQFILDLRLNQGQFVHPTDNDIEKQIEWMRTYKVRERAGLDYYFMFMSNNERIGVLRIYNINWKRLTFTEGSWFCRHDVPIEYSPLMSLINSEIAFDILGLKMDLYDVRKGNKKVLSFHRNIIGAIQYGETELDFLFYITSETRKENRIKELLNID